MSNVQILKKSVKNISLTVKPTGKVILTVPLITCDEHITLILKKRAYWIQQQQENFFAHSSSIQERKLVSGEDFWYIGKRYRLKIIESKQTSVKLQFGYLHVYVNDIHDYDKKEKIINLWYREKALIYFNDIVTTFEQILHIKVQHLKIRKMKTRWGSCSFYKSTINLNIELIKKSKRCIEYVILHELSHLIYPNHSTDFYNYLYTYMCDWKERKILLNCDN